jgi:tape measure domain-containing protein
MTTISSYSVGLALDASSYIRNSSLAGKETASLKRMINSSRSPADKYNRSLALLQKALKEGAISQGTFNKLLGSAKEKLDKAAASDSKLNASKREAARITKSLLTPQERFNASVARLLELRKQGVLSEEMQSRQLRRLKAELASATGATHLHTQAIERGKQIMLSVRTPMQVYAAGLLELSTLHRKGAIDANTHALAQKKLKAEMLASTKAGAASKASLLGMAGAYAKTAGAFALLYGAGSAISKGRQAMADQEQLAIQFKVLTGNAETAEKLMSRLRTFTAATPFREEETMKAAKSLLAFGFSASKVTTRLGRLGNISAATGIPLNELAAVVGKMSQQMTINAEDINQLAGRGINVFGGLAKQMGIAASQVKKMASENKITFADLDAALTDIAENQYGGILAEQADTLNVKWSTFLDNVKQMNKEIAALLDPFEALGKTSFFQYIANNLGPTAVKDAIGVLKGDLGVMEAEARKREAEARLDLARRRKTVDLNKIEREVREKMFGNYIGRGGVGVTGGQVAGGLGSSGSMAAQGLAAGFTQLGNWITSNATVNTQRITQAVTTGSVQSIEAGTQEAYEFLTRCNGCFARARKGRSSEGKGTTRAAD